jgi:hypothetical protein
MSIDTHNVTHKFMSIDTHNVTHKFMSIDTHNVTHKFMSQFLVASTYRKNNQQNMITKYF